MKKIGLLIVFMMSSACAPQEKLMYQNGTFDTTAIGYGGEFLVKTTIENDEIKDIVVSEHNETPSIGGVAIEQMIENMKEKNSYDVDLISGATRSSQALKDAVKDAMNQSKNKE